MILQKLAKYLKKFHWLNFLSVFGELNKNKFSLLPSLEDKERGKGQGEQEAKESLPGSPSEN